MMPAATVTRDARFVYVSPACERTLADRLSYYKRVQTGGAGGAPQFIHTRCYRVSDDVLAAPAGLTKRIVDILHQAGCRISYQDRRTDKLPEPRLDVIDPLRPGQDKILAAIIANDGGVIEAPTAGGKSFLIRQMCRMWPAARIIVCSYSRAVVKNLHAELRETLPADELGLVGAGSRDEARVTCCVDRSLPYCDLDKCDLFIFDEVHRAVSEGNIPVLVRLARARRYGFSASPQGRGDNADLEVECLFGPIIHRQTYQEAQDLGTIVPITVWLYDTRHVRAPMYDNMVLLERHAVWTNKDRNRAIAEAVQDVRKRCGDDLQILVLVKTVEHAVHLGSMMPDFALVYADVEVTRIRKWALAGLLKADEHPLSNADRQALYDGFKTGRVRRVIATPCWSTGVDFPGLGVIVRGDAQASRIANIQIPGRVSRIAEGKDNGLLVDFTDGFNKMLENRSQKRQRIYRGKGWKIVQMGRPAPAILTPASKP